MPVDPLEEAGTVTVWLERLKAGDPAAASPLWRAYYTRLITLARWRLRPVPNAIADEEDIALNAFDSFCRGVNDGRFPDLDDRDDLWKVLFGITAKKAGEQVRYEKRVKRGGGKVVPASQVGTGEADVTAGVEGPEPSPEFAAGVADECRRLLAGLGDDQLRQIAVWKMEGHTNADIATKLNRSIPTVERKLNVIRQIWNRLAPPDTTPGLLPDE